MLKVIRRISMSLVVLFVAVGANAAGYHASVRLSANQSVADSTFTKVTLNTVVTDDNGWVSTTSYRITPTVGSRYLVCGSDVPPAFVPGLIGFFES